ncbi:hypothetical protein JYT86_00195 [bacterium AH-315-N03]|nr:hypothetical protein [bacterium AH-315-N03]
MKAASSTLFRHTKRDAWGLSIILRKLDDRVQMQFQDGRIRTFKNGYYHLLDAVDRPLDVTRSIVRALAAMNDELAARAEDNATAVSMEEQQAYFRELFGGGFQDEEYASHHRGDGRKKPLKRHRDALVKMAEALTQDELRAMLQAEGYAGIHAAAKKVIAMTDLVTVKDRKAFAEMDEAHFEDFAHSLSAMLHGQSQLARRFDAYCRMLERTIGRSPSWGLATVLLGATSPQEHVAVRTKVHSLQARWMAPGLAVSGHPMGLLYERLVQMTKAVEQRLTDAGFAPRDLLDVTDFMWATLRPKAQKRIEEVRFEMRMHGSAAAVTPTDEAVAA